MLEASTISQLSRNVDFGNMSSPKNVEVLGHLSRSEREKFALETKSLVLYFGDEVSACQAAEEKAALAAAPHGTTLRDLNGLNIGCGDRLISPYLTPVDIMRHPPEDNLGGEHHALFHGAILAIPNDLPFRPSSIDYIVALHTLEHVDDPVDVVLHWLAILKPGGGIGVVVPDWRYTWDAKGDAAHYGHKWNPSPDLIRQLYERHWAQHSVLETINTYDFAISFDFVLRRPGVFTPFSLRRLDAMPSGRERAETGRFLG